MSWDRHIAAILLCSLVCFTSGCGEQILSGEDHGNLLDSPSSLTLTESEHPSGWGHAECNLCHNFNNIHIEDRTGLGLDMEAIRDIVFTDGLESCPICHGTNGVE